MAPNPSYEAGMLPVGVAVVAMTVAGATGLTVSARAGGQFGGDLSSEEDTAIIAPSSAFTFGLGYFVRKDAQVEAWYGVQPTVLQVDEATVGVPEIDLLVHHVMLGGMVEIPTKAALIPFIEAGLGAVIFALDRDDVAVESRFGMTFAGGLDVELLKWFRLRAQIDLRLTFLGGGQLFCRGSSCLVTVGDVMAQGNVSGGAVFLF